MRIVLLLLTVVSMNAFAGVVTFKNDQLHIDGVAQPQLFGAELQYFRLRGGYGPNVPRAEVIATWNRALDRMVEAKMNAISFYIPWDFHEYAEGKFDFDGTVDQDGDGNADYPSRDIFTFLKLIKDHGINVIMARPGPYINAEWGFLGFGAIPLWFHEKFPESHMTFPTGGFTDLYDYHNPDFLEYSRRWLTKVYDVVLKDNIGPGKPISFLQIDNETNFMWQSIYNHDYGPTAIARYHDFLKSRYGSLANLNTAHSRNWVSWSNVKAPARAGVNVKEDQDWYRFQDISIFQYLKKIRTIWDNLGVKEPTVLFTLAESYNVADSKGLLPHYHYRNAKNETGFMTVNLYPKTYETSDKTLMNLPFKSDLDVKSADSASDEYIGSKQEFVFGPEIQGGWWRGIDVTTESRQQTYLTTLGHGMKALFVYYFSEGYNWQYDWPGRTNPMDTTTDPLGINMVVATSMQSASTLFFDAPLDAQANPRPKFYDLKKVGEKIAGPKKEFLGKAKAIVDDVCIIKDSDTHVASLVPGIDSPKMNTEWAGGLLGYLLQNGINPRIVHWKWNPDTDLDNCKVIFHQDNGMATTALATKLKERMNAGATVVNLLHNDLSWKLGFQVQQQVLTGGTARGDSFFGSSRLNSKGGMTHTYAVPANCTTTLHFGSPNSGTRVGYECAHGAGRFNQIGVLFYDMYNSDNFDKVSDAKTSSALIDDILAKAGVKKQISIKGGGDRVTVFGRTDGKSIYITTKSGQRATTNFQIQVSTLDEATRYTVTDLMTDVAQELTGLELKQNGFWATLSANGSTVYFIEKK